MTLAESLQKLDGNTVIEMFELDLTGIGGTEILRFHDGVNAAGLSIVWQGLTYTPWPVKAEGFEMSAKGSLPRPTLTVANLEFSLVPYVEDYADMVGAVVTRRRTLAQYLDGQPGADPLQHFEDDVYYIERKTGDDGVTLSFELSSVMDLEGVRLPAREVSVNVCQWEYRGEDCPWRGTTYFDAHDQPVSTLAQDVCSLRPSGCKIRFGATAVLPFGGYVAAKVYKV